MERAHAGPLARQRAADVHEARVVARRADLGPGVEHGAHLVGEHGYEVSAFFTAKVPPKPQHSRASGSSTRSMPRTARSSRRGRSPT